jgi:Flp pilus assembly protein TadG
MVEFALVVPLLLMIVFGAFSGAVAFNNKQDIVYAAREGARYGATIPQSQCTPTANCGGRNWAQSVQAVVVQRSGGEITASEVCVALVFGSPGTVASAPFTTKADGTTCYNDGNGDVGPRVQVSISHAGTLNAVLMTIPLTESSQATAHFEQ